MLYRITREDSKKTAYRCSLCCAKTAEAMREAGLHVDATFDVPGRSFLPCKTCKTMHARNAEGRWVEVTHDEKTELYLQGKLSCEQYTGLKPTYMTEYKRSGLKARVWKF